MKTLISLIGIYIKTISFISAKAGARVAFRLVQTPSKKSLNKDENDFYSTANCHTLNTEVGLVNYYRFGHPKNEIVVLVHGWNSNAASMSAIANQLVKLHYHVVLFDLPGHGMSKLKYLNIVTGKTALKSVINKVASDQKISLISHSLGSMISSITLSEMQIKIKTLVYLTTPDQAATIFETFRNQMNLSSNIYQLLIKEVETLIKKPIAYMNVLERTKTIDYRNLILIHDKHDKVLSYSNSSTLNQLPNSSLYKFEKIGHYRMLKNKRVLEKINNQFGAINEE